MLVRYGVLGFAIPSGLSHA